MHLPVNEKKHSLKSLRKKTYNPSHLFWKNKTEKFSFPKLRQPSGQRLSSVRTQQTKISIRPILFLCYEASLVSSNLNSKQLRFHGVRPKVSSTFENLTSNILVWDVFLVQRDQKTRVKLLFWSRSDRCNKLQFSQGHEIAFVQPAYKSYLFHIMRTILLKHSWDDKKMQIWN